MRSTYRLTFEKRVWIVKQYLKEISTSKIALSQSVTPRTVQKLVKVYERFGWDGLKDLDRSINTAVKKELGLEGLVGELNSAGLLHKAD